MTTTTTMTSFHKSALLIILMSCTLTNATTLPSNALNRWKAVSDIRGGETAVSARPMTSRSSSGGNTLMMDDMNSNASGSGSGSGSGTTIKPKKKRRRRSSTAASASTSSSANSNAQSLPPKRTTTRAKSSTGTATGAATGAAASRQPAGQTQTQTQPKVRSKPPTSIKPSPQQQQQQPITTPSTKATTTTPTATNAKTPTKPEITTSTTTTSTITTTTTTPSYDQMPSIFTPEESIYDKYSACLAATEGLRRIRDSKVQTKRFGTRTAVNVDAESSGGWKSILTMGSSSNNSGSNAVMNGQNTGGSGSAGSSSSSSSSNVNATPSVEQQKEEYKRACAEYVLNSSKVIKALGLSVSQFNQLGREIRKNEPLKEKVMEQAYLYRMASTIKMDKIPLIQDPNSKQLLQSHKRRRVQMFVRSITEIEELRSEQMLRLKRALNIDKLPAHMNLCDPNVLPLLNPQVRAVIEAFPLQAEVIVKKYGLNSDEFNSMLEETRGNPIFRWRVQRFKKKSDDGDLVGSRTSSSGGGHKGSMGDLEF